MQTAQRRAPFRIDRDGLVGPLREIADDRLAERFPDDVIAAWESSLFARMPPAAAMRLLASGAELKFAAGSLLQSARTPMGHGLNGDEYCALVVKGLVRIYTEHGGRQVTQRYVGPGFAFGLPAIFVDNTSSDGQVVTDAVLFRLPCDLLRSLALQDAGVAVVLCHALAECVFENSRELSGNVFRPLRERVAHHLLDLAERGADGRLIVRANPQDIADATGTVREVVTRVIKRMREEGLVIRDGRLFILADPAALHLVAEGPKPDPDGLVQHSS